jgi:hypothetical protein
MCQVHVPSQQSSASQSARYPARNKILSWFVDIPIAKDYSGLVSTHPYLQHNIQGLNYPSSWLT